MRNKNCYNMMAKTLLKLYKTNLAGMATKYNPYIFVVFDNIIAKLGRSTSVLPLNLTDSKNQVFLKKHATTGTISKIPKRLPKCIAVSIT